MPSKKKKYNARFPAGRIKKIMQTDEEVGKVAQAVPVIISRTLELFVESLLTKSMQVTLARNAKTLTPSHMKQCILAENRFDFLKDLVRNIPDPSVQEDSENNSIETTETLTRQTSEEAKVPIQATQPNENRKPDISANFYTEQSTSSANRTPVIQFGPKVSQMEQPKLNFSIDNLVNKVEPVESKPQVDVEKKMISTSKELPVPQLVPPNNKVSAAVDPAVPTTSSTVLSDNVPPLIPLTHNNAYGHNSGENALYIDEDYDN